MLILSKSVQAEESNFWAILQEQVSAEEFKAFIVYVQELETENEAQKNQIKQLEIALEDTRSRVIKLEDLLEKREEELRLCMEENSLWKLQAAEYKFLYDHNKPSVFEQATNKIGIGAGIAAFLYFIVNTVK